MHRRNFLKVLTGTLVAFWGIAVLYPISRYLKKPKDASAETTQDVTVCKVSEINPGESKTFRFGSQPGLLVQDKEGNYLAFDATCTHLGCTTQYRKEKNDLYCACHGGVYDMHGKNIAGPPPRPLISLKVAIKGDSIVVSRA